MNWPFFLALFLGCGVVFGKITVVVDGAGISVRRWEKKKKVNSPKGIRNQLTRDKEWDVRNLILIEIEEICYDSSEAETRGLRFTFS